MKKGHHSNDIVCFVNLLSCETDSRTDTWETSIYLVLDDRGIPALLIKSDNTSKHDCEAQITADSENDPKENGTI